MTNSIDSSRPIMAPSTAAARFSTYSYQAPSLTGTIQTDNSAVAEIRDIATGLDRMENKALSSQRVVLSEKKVENLGKLALGAKLDRALERRMTSQDAVMRPRGKSILLEKEKIQLNENVQQEADGHNAAEGKNKEIESAGEGRRRQKLRNRKRRNYGETIKTRRQR